MNWVDGIYTTLELGITFEILINTFEKIRTCQHRLSYAHHSGLGTRLVC